MFLFPMDRYALLRHVPRNSVAAEIGVAYGRFTRAIMDTTAPAKLHLIDAWKFQEKVELQNDSNNVGQDEQDRRYQGIVETYAADIAAGRVTVHRAWSHQAAQEFPDGYFDWIYLDADHSYDSVKRDLEAFWPKIKEDGLLLGHDYMWHAMIPFGVVTAVNEFVERHGLTFVALNTNDIFPSYVVARPGCPAARTLVADAIASTPCVIELQDYPRRLEFAPRAITHKGKSRVFLGFKAKP